MLALTVAEQAEIDRIEKYGVYGTLETLIEDTFRLADQIEEEKEYSKEEYVALAIKEQWKEKKGSIFVGIFFGITVIHMLSSVLSYFQWILRLNTVAFSLNLWVHVFWSLAPFFAWIYSTKHDFYNFWNRKMALMAMCVINVGIELMMLLAIIFSNMLLPAFAMIPLSEDITFSMVFNLARIVLVIISFGPALAFSKVAVTALYDPMTKREIVAFKLNKILDLRKDKEFSYDMEIVRNLETGAVHNINEKDRYLHSLANGVTGSGKTSSCLTTAINADIEQMAHNREYQKKECEKLLKAGKIRLTYPMKDEEFNIDAFEAEDEKYKSVLNDLKYNKKVAGLTAIAPDASFADEVYNLAHVNGFPVNRIDPLLKNGRLKPGFKGFNPLFITSGLNEIEYIIEVSRKAVLVADVTQAIYDASGTSDVYFASLNKNMTTTVTQLLCFTYPVLHNGKQPTLEDIQRVLNYFPAIEPYRDKFVDLYCKRDKSGRKIKEDGRVFMVLPMFQTILDVIDNELLGDGAEKMNDQCRGLRVVINTFLTDLNVRNVLCSNNSVDMERALARGEITVVNFALELGSSGKALGLFYMLSLINAAYRRPGDEDTRIPNFVYVDELPQLLHPSMEQCFVLFRKYRLAMFVAVQSLSQMDKVGNTAFMKPVLIGNCAHHFVFGRAATEEMELYEKLGGTVDKIVTQNQVNETSITVDNPSISYGRKEQIMKENLIDGGDVHNRDFQEVTVITVDKGSPVTAFFGKVSFLPRYKKKYKKRIYSVSWVQYYDGNGEMIYPSFEDKEESMNASLRSAITKTSADMFDSRIGDQSEREMAPAFLREVRKSEENQNSQKPEETNNDSSYDEDLTSIDETGKIPEKKQEGFTIEI